MCVKAALTFLAAVVSASIPLRAHAVTVQLPSDVFETRPYLWVEAESFASNVDGGTTGNGWKVVSKESPITSVGNVPLPILPSSSNVSGTALLDDIGGGGHEDTALYEVQFITAGTYQLYTRHSMYDSADADSAFGNEDSLYMSPAFNKNSASDWVGFQGLDYNENDINVDIPIPGYAADPDGFQASTGDSANDGWTAIRDWGVKSEGNVTFPNNAAGADWNGNFNWYNRPFFVGANPAGSFASDFGFKTEYVVTEDMVGDTLTFEIGNREHYGVIDGFLFIQVENPYPNNDLLDLYSQEDLDAILPVPIDPDYNGDGVIDAADYVVWRKGESPDDTEAGYEAWKASFGESGVGSGQSNGGVPEPASYLLIGIGLAAFQAMRRRRIR